MALALVVGAVAGAPSRAQTRAELQTFFQTSIGLSEEQIAAIDSGRAVSKALPSRTPREVFLFGVIYVHSVPDGYLALARDFDRLRKLPSYLALGVVSDPPQLSDFKGFSFDKDDIEALKACEPGNCPIQLPASSIKEFQEAVNWSAPDANDQVNQLLHGKALAGLQAYQREGNTVLGVYNDKRSPTEVPRQFSYMLSYYKVFPRRFPDFFAYLLSYPNGRPAGAEDGFYWANVKFGLKPTLRLIHVVTMRANSASGAAAVVAEKQLYSSHYFETALDLTFCIAVNDSKEPGFYLIKVMGSEQAGLTGLKGSIVRGVAVDRSVSSLQKSLIAIKKILEEQVAH